MSHMSYCQREVSGHSYDQTKHLIMLCQSKPIVQCPIWDTQELLHSEGLGQLNSSALPSEIQTASLASTGWFPSTPAAVLGGHLRVGSGTYNTLVPWQPRLYLHLSCSLGTLALPHGVEPLHLSMTLQPWSFYWGYTSTNGLSFDLSFQGDTSTHFQHTVVPRTAKGCYFTLDHWGVIWHFKCRVGVIRPCKYHCVSEGTFFDLNVLRSTLCLWKEMEGCNYIGIIDKWKTEKINLPKNHNRKLQMKGKKMARTPNSAFLSP